MEATAGYNPAVEWQTYYLQLTAVMITVGITALAVVPGVTTVCTIICAFVCLAVHVNAEQLKMGARWFVSGQTIISGKDLDHWNDLVRTQPLSTRRVHSDNPHGVNAADRSAANDHIDSVIAGTDGRFYNSLERYDVSMSRSMVRNGNAGTRRPYDAKDLINHQAHFADEVRSNHVIAFIDTFDHLTSRMANAYLATRNIIVTSDWNLYKPADSSGSMKYRYDHTKDKWIWSGTDCDYAEKFWRKGREGVMGVTLTASKPLLYVLIPLLIAAIVIAASGAEVAARYCWVPFWGPVQYEWHHWTTYYVGLVSYSYAGVLDTGTVMLPGLKPFEVWVPWASGQSDQRSLADYYWHVLPLLAVLAALPWAIYPRAVLRKSHVLVYGAYGMKRAVTWWIPTREISGWIAFAVWSPVLRELWLTRLTPRVVKTEDGDVWYKMSANVGSETCDESEIEHYVNQAGTFTCHTMQDATLSMLLVRLARGKPASTSAGSVRIMAKQGKTTRLDSVDQVDYDAFLRVYGADRYITEPGQTVAFTPKEVGGYIRNPTTPPEGSTKMFRFMQNVLPEMLTPYHTRDNAEVSVAKRMTEPQDTANKSVKPNAFMYQLMDEFVNMLTGLNPDGTGTVHHARLATEEELKERQGRPNQRRQIEEAEDSYADVAKEVEDISRAFGKAENYPSPDAFYEDDPLAQSAAPKSMRIIHNAPSAFVKMAYSLICIGLAAFLKTVERPFETPRVGTSGLHWYAFSRSNKSVAETVAAKLRGKTHVVESDASRQDGTTNWFLRTLEWKLLKRAFPSYLHGFIHAAWSSHHDVRASLYGVKYWTEFCRLSGEAGTSLFNTLAVGFAAYVALRKAGYSPIDAWNRMGIYGGDDGLTTDVDEKQLAGAFRDIGYKPKVNTARAPCVRIVDDHLTAVPADTVEFLARFYGPGVWEGESDSMCTIARTLQQLPNTRQDVSTPEKCLTVAYTKLACLAINDLNTPVFRMICLKIFQAAQKAGVAVVDDQATWKARTAMGQNETLSDFIRTGNIMRLPEGAYPNTYGDWMDTVASRELGFVNMSVLRGWAEDEETHWSQPPQIVPSNPLSSTGYVFVNGVLQGEEPERKKKLCFKFARGECEYGDACKFAHDPSQSDGSGGPPEGKPIEAGPTGSEQDLSSSDPASEDAATQPTRDSAKDGKRGKQRNRANKTRNPLRGNNGSAAAPDKRKRSTGAKQRGKRGDKANKTRNSPGGNGARKGNGVNPKANAGPKPAHAPPAGPPQLALAQSERQSEAGVSPGGASRDPDSPTLTGGTAGEWPAHPGGPSKPGGRRKSAAGGGTASVARPG